MNSKIELRTEAVRIALNVEGVTFENVIETAEKIETYILGSVELPEYIDPQAQLKELSEKFLSKPFESEAYEKVIKEATATTSVAE